MGDEYVQDEEGVYVCVADEQGAGALVVVQHHQPRLAIARRVPADGGGDAQGFFDVHKHLAAVLHNAHEDVSSSVDAQRYVAPATCEIRTTCRWPATCEIRDISLASYLQNSQHISLASYL